MLTTTECRARQARLLRELDGQGRALFLTGNARTVYYLTGFLGALDAPVAFALRADGRGTLACTAEGEYAADEVLMQETYSTARAITRPHHELAGLMRDAIGGGRRHAAVERAGTSGLLEALVDEPGDATETVLRLRKRKHEDEIAEIRDSLRLCAAAYDAARAVMRPGLTELDVFHAMNGAVMQAAGKPVEFPGDFACGLRSVRGGGPATRRALEPGDLYVLDLFPAPALYFGDTCRTFAVAEPTETQQEAWRVVREALRVGEAAVRPGLPASELYRQVKEFLDGHEITEKSFWHHAGHGIGHHGHEAPRLIPGSEDVLEVGDVFTLEPGVYREALQGGIRLEDNYVLTEAGLVNLFDYPMGLRR